MADSFLVRGGGWVVGQSALMCLAVVLGLACPRNWQGAASVVAGIVLCSAGAGLAAAGVWALGSQRTPFPKPRPEAMLVQRGIYSRVRHPLYISVILLAFGWALTARNWPTLAAAGALGIFFDVKARREEKWLREKFPEYSAYEERTCRFLPRVY